VTDTSATTRDAAVRRPSRRRTALAVAVGSLLLAGCNWYPTYGAPTGVTKQGNDTFKLYSGMMTVGVIVGGAVGILIIYTVFRYRKRSDAMPKQFHEHVVLEIIYTVVPILIVAGLFVFTVITENSVDATAPVNATVTSTGTPVVNVDVEAFQWGWTFKYPNLGIQVTGETLNGPGGHGPQMVLPEGETVQITLTSDDVIHGFYVHDFNFSRYALPGVVNIFDLNLTRTGTFPGQCTQFCGLYHSEMLFSVKSDTPAAFNAWVATQQKASLFNGSNAETTPPPGTKTSPASATPPTPTLPTVKASS
jgi:cytochrome c oxidase subunit 2